MKKILICLLILVGCSKQRILSKGSEGDLLKLIEEGNLSSLRMDTTNPNLVNIDDSLMDEYIIKMRMIYPKFNRDLLFSAVAFDDDNQYTVFFRYHDRKCIISTNPSKRIKEVNLCYEKFNICMSGKIVKDITSEQFKKCMSPIECKSLSQIDKGKEIKKSYCETIYGRKL